jgi:hypothetical protein
VNALAAIVSDVKAIKDNPATADNVAQKIQDLSDQLQKILKTAQLGSYAHALPLPRRCHGPQRRLLPMDAVCARWTAIHIHRAILGGKDLAFHAGLHAASRLI